MICKRLYPGGLGTGFWLLLLVPAMLGPARLPAQDSPVADTKVDFASDIKPIFEQNCVRCHGPEEENGDFRIDDRDSVMNYLDPGQSEFSQLLEVVSTDDESIFMPPPEEGERLSDELVEKIRHWIDQGAIWPDGITVDMPAPEIEQAIQEKVQVREIARDQQKASWELVWEIVGLLHPAMVHLPVGLLLGGALFALIGMRSESPLSDAAYYCLWLGAWAAILSCISGWSFGLEKGFHDWQRLEFDKSIDIHRWGAILVATLSFLLALFAQMSRRRDPYGTGFVWKFGLILLACLTGWIAHHGGKMVHTGLHEKLFRKSELLYTNIVDQNKPEPVKVQERQELPKSSADDGAATVRTDEGNAAVSSGEPDGEDADSKKSTDDDSGKLENSDSAVDGGKTGDDDSDN